MILTVQKISFSYPSATATATAALKNVSLSLEKNKILGIAGSSGSGKSTLLNAIYGNIDLNSGEILFNDEKVTGPSRNLIPGHPNMRLAGQFHQLQSSLPVIEQIKYKLLKYEKNFREKKAIELLTLVGLENEKFKLPKELSGGQQQMINLCCALAEEPQLLLLDEPFNNLDQRLKANLKDYILELKNKNISILIVSHDPVDLLSVSDQIIVLEKGKLIQRGSAEETFHFPKNKYCAELFGPVNSITIKGKKKLIRPSGFILIPVKKAGAFSAQIIRADFHGNTYLYSVKTEKYGILKVISDEIFSLNSRLYIKMKRK